MALIIYPATGWNSYISLIEAGTIAIDNIINLTAWTSLTDAQKELYLKQSTTLIRLKIIDPYTTETPADLKLATVHLSVSSIGVDMVDDDGKDNVKRIKIEGALEKEFFVQSKSSNAFPDMVNLLLAQFQKTLYTALRIERV